jgi:RNA polymerase sigma factor (sigma-70 family)
MAKYSDKELSEGLKKGDPEVYAYLWKEFSPRLHFFAAQLIRNTHEAEDIVVTAFEKLIRRGSILDNLVDVRAFLYIITRNLCLDYLRYQARQTEIKKEYHEWLLRVEEVTESNHAIVTTEFMHKLFWAIDKLPPKAKEVFIYTLQGLSVNEVANRLNMTVSNVTSQRMNARKLLQDLLSDKEFLLLIVLVQAAALAGPVGKAYPVTLL